MTVRIGVSGGGQSGPQVLGQKLGKSLRIPRLNLEIKRKSESTISDGNPDDLAETLRKSLIALLEGKLYERGGYQPQIQFLEGGKIILEGKSYIDNQSYPTVGE